MKTLERPLTRAMFRTKWATSEILKAEIIETDSVLIARVIREKGQTILHINPVGFLRYKDEEQAAILVHEIIHIMLKHHLRTTKKLLKKYTMRQIQIAADYEVNSILKDMGMGVHDMLYDKRFHNMPFEKILKELFPEQEDQTDDQNNQACQSQNQKGSSSSGSGDGTTETQPDLGDGENPGRPGRPGNKTSADQPAGAGKNQKSPGRDSVNNPVPGPEDVGQFEPYKVQGKADDLKESESMDRALVQASVAAQGNLPAALKRILERIQTPPMDWRQATQDFVSELDQGDFSWRRPKQRYGALLPTTYDEALGSIMFAIDTSGSVTRQQLNLFASQLLQAMEQISPKKLYVCWFDTRTHIQEFGVECPPTLDELKPRGGGGTDYMPVIKAAEDNAVDGLIILTDGECTRYRRTSIPILWVLTGRVPRYFKPPHGQVVKLEDIK